MGKADDRIRRQIASSALAEPAEDLGVTTGTTEHRVGRITAVCSVAMLTNLLLLTGDGRVAKCDSAAGRSCSHAQNSVRLKRLDAAERHQWSVILQLRRFDGLHFRLARYIPAPFRAL